MKSKARETDHLKLLNVFVIIGYNYRRVISYKVSNKVDKMKSKAYKHLIDQLRHDVDFRGLTLWQDADSAHTSASVKKYCEEVGFKTITSPGVSPDFSIVESLAYPLKREFHKRRTNTT